MACLLSQIFIIVTALESSQSGFYRYEAFSARRALIHSTLMRCVVSFVSTCLSMCSFQVVLVSKFCILALLSAYAREQVL
jgi:hypothetical protein